MLIQLFRGIKNISVSFIRSEICSVLSLHDSPKQQQKFLKQWKLQFTHTPGSKLKRTGVNVMK